DYLNSTRATLATKQKQLDDELVALSGARKRSEKSIFDKQLEIERLKNEITNLQTRAAEAEAKRANLEAEEMKARTEWAQLKIETAENLKQRDQALQEVAEATKRHEQALKDLAEVKVSLSKSQKVRDDATKKAQSDIARYEKDIIDADKAR